MIKASNLYNFSRICYILSDCSSEGISLRASFVWPWLLLRLLPATYRVTRCHHYSTHKRTSSWLIRKSCVSRATIAGNNASRSTLRALPLRLAWRVTSVERMRSIVRAGASYDTRSTHTLWSHSSAHWSI